MKFIYLLLSGALTLMSLPVLAVDATGFPQRAVITMRGYWGFMPVGTAVQTWTLKDGRYHLENRMSGMGVRIRYVSDGAIVDGLMQPLYYAEFRGKDSQPRYESRFNAEARTVSLGKPAEQRSTTMQLPIQDLNALPFDLAWREGKPTSYPQLSNGRRLKQGAFARAGEEIMEFGDQKVKVIHLISRQPNKDAVEVWLAPEYKHMPLRIKFTGSEKIELQAVKLELDGKTVLSD